MLQPRDKIVYLLHVATLEIVACTYYCVRMLALLLLFSCFSYQED